MSIWSTPWLRVVCLTAVPQAVTTLLVRVQLRGFRKALRVAAGRATSQLLEEFEAIIHPADSLEQRAIGALGTGAQVKDAAIDLLIRAPFLPQDQELVAEWLGSVFTSCPVHHVQRHLLQRLSRPKGWTTAHVEALVRAAATSSDHRIRLKAVTMAASRQDWACLRSLTGDAHSEVRAEAVCALIDAAPDLMDELLDCLLQPGATMEAVERADKTFLRHPHRAFRALGKALLDGKYRDYILVNKLRRLGVEPFCRELLQGSDPGGLDLGIALAGRLGLSRLAPQLVAVFENSRDPATRAKIIDAWQQMASPQALECLRLVTRGMDSASARRAEQALGTHRCSPVP